MNRQSAELAQAVDKAITDMPKDFVIRPYLEAHRSEVKGMLLTEYNEVEAMELFREEGREEGFIDALISLVKDGLISTIQGAERAGMSEEEFQNRMAS